MAYLVARTDPHRTFKQIVNQIRVIKRQTQEHPLVFPSGLSAPPWAIYRLEERNPIFLQTTKISFLITDLPGKNKKHCKTSVPTQHLAGRYSPTKVNTPPSWYSRPAIQVPPYTITFWRGLLIPFISTFISNRFSLPFNRWLFYPCRDKSFPSSSTRHRIWFPTSPKGIAC